MTLWDIFIFALEAIVVFIVSTALFDALHWMLHKWEGSRFKPLRTLSSWHWVHHKFLGPDMQIDAAYARQNIWFHIVPEFLTAMAGTLIFLLVLPWPPVALVAAIRLFMLVVTLKQEGLDYNHMAMDHVGGQQGLLWVNQHYHAMHHIYPHNFFSSFANLFDLVFGTTCQIEGRNFLVTGAGGAFGSAMVKKLQALGANVRTAKSGIDFAPGSSAGMAEKLAWADVLVLSHGAKSQHCRDANYTTFVDLIDRFAAQGQTRLAPPEVWALGSEAELHGDMGRDELKDYAASKRAFAARAVHYYRSPALLYRHIVPSSFTSAMGKGPMSAATAVSIALFFIRRGFTYVPVTLTGMAYLNYFRFRFLQKHGTGDAESAQAPSPNAP